MTEKETIAQAVRYWMNKADESLLSAWDEMKAGRLSFSINRCYYASFYAASAVLLSRGHRFSKHSGVRAALHQFLVKPGLLSNEWGRFYDRLFYDRQEGDYIEFVDFNQDEVEETVFKSNEIVSVLKKLVKL